MIRRIPQPHTIPAQPAFYPVYIGRSPAGVHWTAYRPEHVASMRAAFQRTWDRHHARAAARAEAPL